MCSFRVLLELHGCSFFVGLVVEEADERKSVSEPPGCSGISEPPLGLSRTLSLSGLASCGLTSLVCVQFEASVRLASLLCLELSVLLFQAEFFGYVLTSSSEVLNAAK